MQAKARIDAMIPQVEAMETELATLRERVEELESALEHAIEWLAEEGCDCGTDEPGTCALCEAQAALGEREGQSPGGGRSTAVSSDSAVVLLRELIELDATVLDMDPPFYCIQIQDELWQRILTEVKRDYDG